jgi:hypothetical protein
MHFLRCFIIILYFFFALFYNIEAKNESQVLIKRKKSKSHQSNVYFIKTVNELFEVLFGKPSPEY